MAYTFGAAIYTVVVVFLLQKCASFLYLYVRQWYASRNVPGLPGTGLLLGDLANFKTFEDYLSTTIKYVQSTGVKMHKIWVYFWYPIISIDHPDTAKVLFRSNVPKIHGINSGYTLLRPWIGDGLLSNKGDKKWERNRHLLTPAFHFDILKQYAVKFNSVADALLKKFAQDCDRSIEISQTIATATLDALLRCAFSYDGNVQALGLDHPYVRAVDEITTLFMERFFNQFMHPDFIYKRTKAGKRFFELCDYVHEFADSVIAARKKSLENQDLKKTTKRDFLDILLEARDESGKGLTDLEIRDEVDTFLFAGHDTTSSAITWGIYALGKYPEIQQRVYNEVMEVVGKGEVEWAHLGQLKYLQCFIKEVMRMYSTVPMIGRGLAQPLTFENITLPTNTFIEIDIHAINHHPDVWPDHEEFRPERFDETAPERNAFSFIPFSAGSRNCIGQNFAMTEQKVVFSRIVQAFHVELDEKHDVQLLPVLVMKAKHGINVFFRPR